jgi:hypothetical protein
MNDPLRCGRIPGTGITLPGTPAGDAAMLRPEIERATYELGRGRGDLTDAERLLGRASQMVMTLPACEQVSFAEAVDALRLAVRERVVTAPVTNGAALVGPGPRTGAPSGRDPAPQAAAAHIATTVARHLAGGEDVRAAIGPMRISLRDLARLDRGVLDAQLRAAGITGSRAEEVHSALAQRVGDVFRQRALEHAENRLGAIAEQLDRARSGLGMRNVVANLDPQLLAGLEVMAGPEAVAAIHDAMFARSAPGLSDPDRAGLDVELRAAVSGALETAAERVRDLRAEVHQLGVHDPYGYAHRLFPGAMAQAASEAGLSQPRASALGTGNAVGNSVLEHCVATDVAERGDARHVREVGARLTIATAGVILSAFSGGTAAGLCAVAAHAGAESVEVGAAYAHARDMRAAAGAGLNTREAAVEAEHHAEGARDFMIAGAAVGVVGAGAHGVEHAVEASEGVLNATHVGETVATGTVGYGAVAAHEAGGDGTVP